MQPLNPFLRAFFRSPLPDQCTPNNQFILLVPDTELLLTSKDHETQIPYTELLLLEDFLASHVLRASSAAPLAGLGRDTQQSSRNNKTKQFTTLNGRTVIIKDSTVYTGKGYKLQGQAQLLNDSIFWPDTVNGEPWKTCKVSKPLIGVCEPILQLDGVPGLVVGHVGQTSTVNAASSNDTKKKEPKSFAELLIHFPMIARQMQPGLDRIVRELIGEIEKPLPAIPSTSAPVRPKRPRASSAASSVTLASRLSGRTSGASTAYETWGLDCQLLDEEEGIRMALEAAITASIDLFQLIDKHQLSLLGSTTDLTGTQVEQMLEQHIVQHVHERLLFPALCARRQAEDSSLDSQVRHMSDVDLTQVGLPLEQSLAERQELAGRIAKGVEAFKKINGAQSGLEMLQILLATQKALSDAIVPPVMPDQNGLMSPQQSEKQDPLITSNADTLVSLLLMVVIRSSVRHLRARFVYMRYLVFTDDPELGESGYALSTFEAVLTYLTNDSIGLRKASKRNARLWAAIRSGDLADLKAILAASVDGNVGDFTFLQLDGPPEIVAEPAGSGSSRSPDPDGDNSTRGRDAVEAEIISPLSHIFPFQRPPTPPPEERPKSKKRVSLAARSLSQSSAFSASSIDANEAFTTATDDDFSLDTLLRSRGPSGESILMMAIDSGKLEIVQYLLSLHQYFSIDEILVDQNNDGVTLLSAAVQSEHGDITSLLLHILHKNLSEETLRQYLTVTDIAGRCVAHYFFHLPQVIYSIGDRVSWTVKDKNGQTPLFALCRSYDHRDYRVMVELGIRRALKQQSNADKLLHLDAHVDNKGNTLLHIANDPQVIARLLFECDSNPNAKNDKAFTPLMVASKFSRMEIVRLLIGDPRVDIFTRDVRGLTAAELAKDDEVRNRIDDLVLLLNSPTVQTRRTAVVRSLIVEDGACRMVVKCAERNADTSITVTTCRRAVADFVNLARMLATEQPASWIPDLSNLLPPTPFPIRSSRAVMRDWQVRLDAFLNVLMTHPQFKNHEMVWEFILVPDIDMAMLADRSKRKAEHRAEMIRDEFTPVEDVREIEVFVSHAKDTVRGFHHAMRSVLRRINAMRQARSDLVEAASLLNSGIQTVAYIPPMHRIAIDRYATTLTQISHPPYTEFFYSMTTLSSTIAALLKSLNRPSALIGSILAAQKLRDRHAQSLRRNDRWPLGILDDTRKSLHRDAIDRVEKSENEIASLGKELRHTQQTVAVELAAWQEGRVRMGREACRTLARRIVVVEKDRLRSMLSSLRILGIEGRKKDRNSDRPGTNVSPL